MTDWNNKKPVITNGKINYSDSGLLITPDGDIDNPRRVIDPSGVNLTPSDFDGLTLPQLAINTPNKIYILTVSNDGFLLIDGQNKTLELVKEYEQRIKTLEEKVDKLERK